jgi:phage terminase large subunit-like protein
MNTPMKELERLIYDGELEHGGDPVLRWHISNTMAKMRTFGGGDNMMPTKTTDKARIDAIVATLIALGIYIWKMKEKLIISQSIVKNQGIVSIKLRR